VNWIPAGLVLLVKPRVQTRAPDFLRPKVPYLNHARIADCQCANRLRTLAEVS